jgi:hypothetical protein
MERGKSGAPMGGRAVDDGEGRSRRDRVTDEATGVDKMKMSAAEAAHDMQLGAQLARRAILIDGAIVRFEHQGTFCDWFRQFPTADASFEFTEEGLTMTVARGPQQGEYAISDLGLLKILSVGPEFEHFLELKRMPAIARSVFASEAVSEAAAEFSLTNCRQWRAPRFDS